MNYPFRYIHLDGLDDKVAYAQFLHDASEVKIIPKPAVEPGSASHCAARRTADQLVLEIPPKQPPVEIPVIELILK